MSRYPASPVKEMRKTSASTPQTRKLRICRKGTEAASGQSACMSAYVLQFNSIGAGEAASCRVLGAPRKSETNVAEYGQPRSNYSGIRVPSSAGWHTRTRIPLLGSVLPDTGNTGWRYGEIFRF